MSRIIVKTCQIPEYKLTISTKRLVWYRSPLDENSAASINIYGANVDLYFSNNPQNQPREVEYRLGSSEELQQFYKSPLVIELMSNKEVIGFCRFQTKAINEKVIIAPVISVHKYQNKEVKLGDIEIKFNLKRSASNVRELYKVKEYLDDLDDRPMEFESLVNKLTSQHYL